MAQRWTMQRRLENTRTLFLLRNPEARTPVSVQREETAQELADFIAAGATRLGGTLSMHAVELARVIMAESGDRQVL